MQNREDDPFEDYGFGIIAYFNLMWYLIVIYMVCSAIAGFMMYKYTYGNSLEDENGGSTNQFALGNFGFTSYRCENQFVGLGLNNVD